MKLAVEPKNIIRSDNFQESRFSIQASSKAFTILSSSLYSDKYKAIVRELCTNASDAHAAAGIKERPIEVTCPNFISPKFSVKDYGLGIDPEEFTKIYTTYFYSTKTDTNDQVGCFGLGSKSPFAYTDNFTVENCYKGTRYLYQCFKNEFGEPSVALLGKYNTDDTGIRISFPVKQGDSTQFEIACKKVLSFFDVKPICNVDIEQYIGEETVTILCLQHSSLVPSNINIRMGQVVYAVDQKYFEGLFHYRAISIIDVPIGYVDITPSRETIEYTPRTIKNLESIKESIVLKLSKSVDEVLDDKTISNFAKYKKLNTMSHGSIGSKIISIGLDKVRHDNRYESFCYLSEDAKDNKYKFETMTWYKRNSWRKTLEKGSYSVHINKDVFILIKRGSNRSLMAKINYLIDSNRDIRTVITFDSSEEQKLISLGFNKDDFLYSDEVVIPKEVLEKVKVVKNKTNCCYVNNTGYKSIKSGTYLDKDQKEGVYVLDNEHSGVGQDMWFMTNHYTKTNKEVLYVFTEKQYKALKISERNFVHIVEYYKKQLLAKRSEVSRILFNDNKNSKLDFLAIINWGNKTTTDNIFKKFAEKYSNTVSKEEAAILEVGANALSYLGDSLFDELKKEISELEIEYQKDLRELWLTYPLTALLINTAGVNQFIDIDGVTQDGAKMVAEYIDMVENKNGEQK